jgi:hypothetical protein
MSRPKQSIAEQLHAAQLAVNNSLTDPEIQSLVSGFGYTAEKLTEGRYLFECAEAAVTAQRFAAGAQQDATQTVEETKRAAVDAYQALAKVARAVANPAQLAALGLVGGRMPRSTAGFLAAAYTLFDNAPNLTSLAEYGYTPEKLAAERVRISVYDHANQTQEAAKGAAQQSTREAEAALTALREWTARYIKVARVALREKPQLLEKLGVVARTSKTAAQRAALRKVED